MSEFHLRSERLQHALPSACTATLGAMAFLGLGLTTSSSACV